MTYRVNCLVVNEDDFQWQLAKFINDLEGEVISVVPHITNCFLCYGAKIGHVLVVEKIR